MDNKKMMIIAAIILIIVAAILFVALTSQQYERIEVTPNGTSMDVPFNQTKYAGEVESAKIWNWKNGILVTYNSYEDGSLIKVGEMGFNTLKQIIENGEKQDIDGYTCYVINADEVMKISIFDIIKVNYNGKFYCIPLSNQTTHDNILICCNNRDIAVHMAKSVEYKNVFPNKAGLNDTLASIENMTGELESKANDLANNTNLSEIQSKVEEAGINLDNVKSSVEQYSGKLPI
ncbi:hypothetical protein [uncultured Methanobrevibacter sp.]|jgi:hypothetical protein|uniref:hypothetical protein n=1 Tax=uncultured Methanobrevibacter sp. TaxID=253161 RepID=UPI0025DFD883|nr:hypothetical protein [uncultured Methanobrevibacter sp.]